MGAGPDSLHCPGQATLARNKNFRAKGAFRLTDGTVSRTRIQIYFWI